jgi:hypothetical protein
MQESNHEIVVSFPEALCNFVGVKRLDSFGRKPLHTL